MMHLRDVQIGHAGIAAPQDLRIDDVIKIQDPHQLKHGADILVIHAGKGFIQRQQPWAGITALYILCGDRSEQRHIHRHSLFPAAEAVESPVRQFLLSAVSPIKKQVELVPVPVVQHRTDQIRIIDRQPLKARLFPGAFDFAAKMTGNPHAFDAGSSGGKLLYQVVKTDLAKRQIQIDDKTILRSYQRQRSYLAVGLLIDDVSNYAMLYNVQALQKDGEKHPGMAGFCEEKDMVQVPLSVMMKWEKMQCPDQKILIVENPSVFATLCADDDGSHAYMCMNGQPRLAALVAMDLLAAGGTAVSYAGDLDPEGLLIGQKLAEYYPSEFQFVYMAAEDYKQSMSNETVSDRRIKMLDRINHPQLLDVVAAIRKYRRAGYQELVDLRERES